MAHDVSGLSRDELDALRARLRARCVAGWKPRMAVEVFVFELEALLDELDALYDVLEAR